LVLSTDKNPIFQRAVKDVSPGGNWHQGKNLVEPNNLKRAPFHVNARSPGEIRWKKPGGEKNLQKREIFL